MKQNVKKKQNSLLLITSQTGDLTFHFGSFPYALQLLPRTDWVKTNQRHLKRTVGLWRDWARSDQPAALSLLLSFSFPSHSLFLSCLFKERKVGKFLQATLLQVFVGFKHAHWGCGTVHVRAVVSDSALYRGGHFVTIGEVSFYTA